MSKSLGKDTRLDHVAEVSGRDGKPQPTQWKIILRETVGRRVARGGRGRGQGNRP